MPKPLIFERSRPGRCAAVLPDLDVPPAELPAGLVREDLPLPEVSELDLVRHYTKLAHRCFSIDEHFYPLGSCTMKYNPRLAERAAEDGDDRDDGCRPGQGVEQGRDEFKPGHSSPSPAVAAVPSRFWMACFLESGTTLS